MLSHVNCFFIGRSSHLIGSSTTTHGNVKNNQNSNSHANVSKTVKGICSCTSCAAFCFNPSMHLSNTDKDRNARQSSIFNRKTAITDHYNGDYEKTTRVERLDMIRFEDSLQNLLLFPRM